MIADWLAQGGRVSSGAGREAEIVPVICGIGNISAAVSLTAAMEKNPPDEILFVGSAGSYEPAPDEFRAAISNSFVQREIAALEGRARKPDAMISTIDTRRGPLAAAIAARGGFQEGRVNCVEAVTLMEPGQLFDGLAFENMECFGLAWAAAKVDVPFSALFAITNTVGPDGSAQWRRNYRAFSQELQKRIIDCVTSLR